jgi:hypothetical protein
VRHRGASKGANTGGRVPGVKVCLNHRSGRFLTQEGYHQRGQLRNHTEHAFFKLAGHCVDGYLIKIHGSEIFFE